MAGPSSNKEWLFWGRTDPLFGVATVSGRHRDGAAPWTRADFLESGRRYFADVWRQWSQYGVAATHCVEIGCGSARITYQLAQVFDHVTAVDVSQHQLELAAEMLADQGGRVALHRVDDPSLPLPDATVDAVFSCEVFQHFDSYAPMRAYIAEAFRVLQPGGTFAFQVPVRGVHKPTFLSSSFRTRVLQVLRLFGRRRMMIYQRVDADTLIASLDAIGFIDIEMRVFRVADHHGVHAYFFARRPSP